MMVFLFSPFSHTDVFEKEHRTLLVLFILKEFIKPRIAKKRLETASGGPFEWTEPRTSKQKLQEYFSLLPLAFPELALQVPSLRLPSKKLFSLLEPFIVACASSENLLLFLVQHQKELATKPLLDRICPEGIEAVRDKIAAGFRKRGYYFTRWTHTSEK